MRKKIASDDENDEFSDIDLRGPFGETKSGTTPENVDHNQTPHVYAIRWIILAVLSTTLAINACILNLNGDFQSNILIFYRRLAPGNEAFASWLAESLFFALHIGIEALATIAAVLVLELRGLRITCLVGITMASMGAWIRSASLNNNMYSILFAGLVLCDIGQVYMANAVFYLSSKWFPHRQTATSISIGLASNSLGVLMATLFRLFFENNQEYRNFNHPYYGSLLVSIVATLALGLAIIFIRDDPMRAPSLAQCHLRMMGDESNKRPPAMTTIVEINWTERFLQLGRTCWQVVSNLSFIKLAISFALIVASTNVIYMILNPVLNEYQKTSQYLLEISLVSFLLFGLIASIAFGIILDFTKSFKLLLFILYSLSLVFALCYALTLGFNDWFPIVFLALFSLFAFGLQPVGFEYALELTFPCSVPVTCGILNILTQLFTAIFRSFAKAKLSSHSPLQAHVFMLLFMAKGLLVTVFILKDYKRYEINTAAETNTF